MFAWFVLVILLCLYKIKWKPSLNENIFFEDYMSKEKTNSIKGIFVLLVFLSHAKGYCSGFNDLDSIYLFVNEQMGQLVVVPFLVYSGYGVMKQYMIYGTKYMDVFPRKRIFCTLINFDIAVILYLLLQTYLGKKYSAGYILSCLIGWNDLGNSNWYIFSILVLYIMFWVCTKYRGKDVYTILCNMCSLITIYTIVMSQIKESWWYDTVFCFFLGMLYHLIEEKWNSFVNDFETYVYTFAGLGFLFILSFMAGGGMVIGNVNAIVFGMLLIWFSKKICIDNKILRWLGSHVFSIYILQRLSFIFIKEICNVHFNNFCFIGIGLCSTMLLAYVFDFVTSKINKLMIN